VHRVTLSRPFELSPTLVTVGRWREVMTSAPSRRGSADAPLDLVTWYDAIAFCNALSRGSGLEEAYVLTQVSGQPGEPGFTASVGWKGPAAPGYRLPTEAEWEYACRGGTLTTRYGHLSEVAWYSGNASGAQPVARKRPNAFGLYDMLGDLWEWVWDVWGDYPAGPVTDPTGAPKGADRVLRGGSWRDGPEGARASARAGVPSSHRSDRVGFRVARTLPT
jgi:sulfatase modifying factor 1